MTRAMMLLYDEVPARRARGSHGIEQWLLTEVYGTLEETPIAQVALSRIASWRSPVS